MNQIHERLLELLVHSQKKWWKRAAWWTTSLLRKDYSIKRYRYKDVWPVLILLLCRPMKMVENTAEDQVIRMMEAKRGLEPEKIQILVPKRSSLKHRLRTSDHLFLDFVRSLLEIDPAKRPTAKEAMNHPWLTEAKYPENEAYANL